MTASRTIIRSPGHCSLLRLLLWRQPLSSYAGYFYLEDVARPEEPLQLWEVAEIDVGEGHPLAGVTPLNLELRHSVMVVARAKKACEAHPNPGFHQVLSASRHGARPLLPESA